MKPIDPKAKVFLIYPALESYAYKIQVQDRESLALGYLIAALERKNVPVNAVNAELLEVSNDQVIEMMAACQDTILVGISAGSEKAFPHIEVMAQKIKATLPNAHITIGGIFATSAHEDILNQSIAIDSVSMGEGERVIHSLYEGLLNGAPLDTIAGIKFRADDGTIQGKDAPRIKDLDDLPFPSRVDLEYMLENGGVRKAKIATSRGCYARCTFCSIHEIFGDRLVYRRSPANIVAEIRMLKERFGVTDVSFMDDLFITPSKRGRQWVMDFCDLIRQEDLGIKFWVETRADTLDREIMDSMISAGLDSIFIGIEAGSSGVLEKMQKDVTAEQNRDALVLLRQTSLDPENVRFGYIMFTPDMSFAELQEQFTWIRDSNHCRVQTLQNRMNIYRGTPEFKRLFAENKLRMGDLGTLAEYDFDDPQVGEFEHAFRAFHLNCVAEVFDDLHKLQRRYIRQKQTSFRQAPKHVRSMFSQLLRNCEQLERQHYIDFFEAGLFGTIEERNAIGAKTKADLPEICTVLTTLDRLLTLESQDALPSFHKGTSSDWEIALDDRIVAFDEHVEIRDIMDHSCRIVPLGGATFSQTMPQMTHDTSDAA